MGVIAEYADLDGLAIADLVRSGQISASDVLDTVAHLTAELNGELNAIVRPMHDEAARDAAAGLPPGPFRGVPIVLKDEYISYAGVPNDQSSRLAAGLSRPYDTHLVKAYKAAGMLVVGKANLPEFGASSTSDALLYGPARNPWDLTRNAGGSSGGSASAVAAGIVPIGYANDGAGSIRIPASCCGLFGLKPTRARVSTGPDGGEYWNGLVIEHAVTRSVRDSAALLDATDTPQPGDLYHAPRKARPFLDEVACDPRPLRIAFSAKPPIDVDVSPDCVAAMEDTARLCEQLGHHVEEAAPQFNGPGVFDAITKLLCIHLAYGIDELAAATGRPATREIIESATFELARRGRTVSATDMLGILELFAATARKVAPFWQTYDVLLTPTLASPAVPNGYIYTDDPDADRYARRAFREFIPFTPLANVTGNPAMTLPLSWNSRNLPVGSHFIGRFGDEATLFGLAGQIERARPWRHRHPPFSAWAR